MTNDTQRNKSHLPTGGVSASDDLQGRPLALYDRDLWPDVVEGADLLDALRRVIHRYVILDEAAEITIAMWILASYCADSFYIFPRLVITSPVKRCGKSTLLRVIAALVNRPLAVGSATAASITRAISMFRPTLLLDEADTYLIGNREMRGIINEGHLRDGTALRNVGKNWVPRIFNVFSPMVIAGIGRVGDTIEDRAHIVRLRRKGQSEHTAEFRSDRDTELADLGRKCARWAQDNADALSHHDPQLPRGVGNRLANNWRPLFAVADACGGEWPKRARSVAQKYAAAADDEGSVGEMLLADTRTAFTELKADELTTLELLRYLKALPHRPWGDQGERPLNPHRLSALLRPFGIGHGSIRRGDGRPKGYKRVSFHDAWECYLPPFPPEAATPLQCAEQIGAQLEGHPLPPQTRSGSIHTEEPRDAAVCSGVADPPASTEICAQPPKLGAGDSDEDLVKSLPEYLRVQKAHGG